MRILNLYAGIGGNRRLWGDSHDIVAVENDPDIARVYQEFYPEDGVVVADAHQFLLDHYREFDFIWSSPPCQTHTQWRRIDVKVYGSEPKYPDMTLYQEIIFLQHHAEAKWVVENVIPYYQPLLQPNGKIHRHLYWSNFELPKVERKQSGSLRKLSKISELEALHQVDLSQYQLKNKRQILRNCVDSEVGLEILKQAIEGEKVETIDSAATLF